MVDTLDQSDQDNDASNAELSKRRRIWLLAVASTDVLLVITSMVALNAALPDLAVEASARSGSAAFSATIDVITNNTSVLATVSSQIRLRLDSLAIEASF